MGAHEQAGETYKGRGRRWGKEVKPNEGALEKYFTSKNRAREISVPFQTPTAPPFLNRESSMPLPLSTESSLLVYAISRHVIFFHLISCHSFGNSRSSSRNIFCQSVGRTWHHFRPHATTQLPPLIDGSLEQI